MPKEFVTFLIIAQAVLIACHAIIFGTLLLVFPQLRAHAQVLLWVFFILSISFLGTSILDFKTENQIVRIFHIFSAVWIPIFGYGLIATVLLLVAYVIFPAGAQTVAYVLFGLSLALATYGLINARIRKIMRLQLTLPTLPAYWEDKTIVMVSDLHLGHILREKFATKIIALINEQKPDLVLIPGDFFDGVKTTFTELAALFSKVQSTHGIYYVTGNHEAFAGYKLCEEAIAKAGIHILENQKVEVEGLQIAGLAYFSESKETKDQVINIIQSLHIDSTRPSIVLKHVPNFAREIAEAGITLQFSGHTHHGQTWPGRFITRRVYKGFDYGLKQIGKHFIYISSGIGTWGPPIRAFTKSELVKITLKR